MNHKMQWGISGMILIGAIIWRFALSGDGKKKPSAKVLEFKPEAETAEEEDVKEKNKIMSELGKKGAAKSAKVRKAKAARKKAEKEAMLDEFST